MCKCIKQKCYGAGVWPTKKKREEDRSVAPLELFSALCVCLCSLHMRAHALYMRPNYKFRKLMEHTGWHQFTYNFNFNDYVFWSLSPFSPDTRFRTVRHRRLVSHTIISFWYWFPFFYFVHKSKKQRLQQKQRDKRRSSTHRIDISVSAT